MMQQWIAVHRTATERHQVLLKHSPGLVGPVSGVLRCLVTVKYLLQLMKWAEKQDRCMPLCQL